MKKPDSFDDSKKEQKCFYKMISDLRAQGHNKVADTLILNRLLATRESSKKSQN
ncbi:hypothetical protein [Bacillus gobiensis]|uniref:hypothetical protein n=1 Tax=Bacillus gobiensis TaxID=1441095 RepID=UPI003D1F12BD